MKLFALNAARDFGEKVAQELKIPLSKHKEKAFHDGESYVASEENVRGSDVYVIQSLYGDNEESVNDRLLKLLIFLGSLHDASAKRIIAVLPFFCYGRQDRKTSSRAPITTKYLAHFFQSVFTKRVLTIDAHNSGALQNAYSVAHFDNLEACGLFAKFIATELCKNASNLVVLSPDEGRLKASRKFRNYLEQYLRGEKIDIACVDKVHEDNDIHANALIGNVKHKRVLIYDDMISSGKTVLEAVNVARDNHAVCVEAVCATHGLFVGNANEYLDDPFLQNIIITDTVKPFRVTNNNIRSRISILNTHLLFAEAIRRTHKGESISDLIQKNGLPLSFERLYTLDRDKFSP